MRVCLDIDLAKPLKQGFWLEDDGKKVFIIVQYEKLPTFCYNYGLVGHGATACTHRRSVNCGDTPSGARSVIGNVSELVVVVMPKECSHEGNIYGG